MKFLWIVLMLFSISISAEEKSKVFRYALPMANYVNAPLSMVAENLEKMSKALDPKKEGIKVVFADGINGERSVSIESRHQSFEDLALYISIAKKIDYKIEGNILTFVEGERGFEFKPSKELSVFLEKKINFKSDAQYFSEAISDLERSKLGEDRIRTLGMPQFVVIMKSEDDWEEEEGEEFLDDDEEELLDDEDKMTKAPVARNSKGKLMTIKGILDSLDDDDDVEASEGGDEELVVEDEGLELVDDDDDLESIDAFESDEVEEKKVLIAFDEKEISLKDLLEKIAKTYEVKMFFNGNSVVIGEF